MLKNILTYLMESEKKNLLSIFFTAGYPNLYDTIPIIKALEKAGVDFIELGMPYSDPLADGPIIQMSNQKALENGMNLKLLFDQLQEVRKEVQIPILLMGYLNSVEFYGKEAFCEKCKAVGVDGLILPDMPVAVYEREYKELFKHYNLSNIFLITPQTSKSRIQEYDRLSNGFLYAVSSASTTGSRKNIQNSETFLAQLQELKLQNPLVTGFNIRDKESFEKACRYTRGGIIGSAFIQAIENSRDLNNDIKTFINRIR